MFFLEACAPDLFHTEVRVRQGAERDRGDTERQKQCERKG